MRGKSKSNKCVEVKRGAVGRGLHGWGKDEVKPKMNSFYRRGKKRFTNGRQVARFRE